jgi:two-component system NarL family sensor kinase
MRTLQFLYLVLLLLLPGLISCNKKVSNSDHDKQQTNCTPGILDQYAALVEKQAHAADLTTQLRKFYQQSPDGCHNAIARRMFDDVFDIAFRSGSQDTSELGFFRSLAQDQTLTEKNRVRVFLFLGMYHLYILEDPSSSARCLQSAYDNKETFDDSLSKSYNALMGNLMLRQSDLKRAANFYLETIRYAEKLKDSASLAKTYANFGIVYNKLGQYQKSIEMQRKAYEFFESRKDLSSVIIACQGIAVNFAALTQYDSALYYYDKALNYAREIQSPRIEFDILFSIAGIQTGKNDYATSLVYYDKAKAILKKMDNPSMEQIFVIASTPAYAKVRDVRKEIELIKSYIPEFSEQNDLSNVRNCYHVLYHTYYIKNDKALALDYYRRWDSIGDLLAEDKNREYITELETKYETEKKELRIKVQQKEIQQKNTLNSFLIALLALGCISSALIVTRIRLKRNRKEQVLQQEYTQKLIENTELERERIARDLHDGVSQELMILKNQFLKEQNKANSKIDLIINEIRMISRDLHPVILDKIGLKASIEHTCEQMMEAHHVFIVSDVHYNATLEKNNELQLFRIVQEGLNNIIKYASAEAARVSLTQKGDSLLLTIEDNGKGFDVAEALNSKKSFGIVNIIQRAKSMQGKADISSSPSGTTIKIEIPVTPN